jgi:acyl-CoA synthetase (AMP-forming)/AMP-acid ligase II
MTATAQNFMSTNSIVPDDVYLLAGPIYHVGLAVSIGYWRAGARTMIMNFEPAKALSLMEREGVTRMVATGTIFKMLVDEIGARLK